jgi:serine/threonine protein kinase
MAQLVDLGGSPANPMERETITRLVRALPSVGWSVIPNASLPDRATGHAYEYDAIIVAPHAVYAVEMKGWGGRIRQLGQADWERGNGRIEKNPLPLIDLKARVLASTLKSARLGGRRAPYVQGCLIVGHEDAEFDVPPLDARRCLRPSEAADYLRDPARLHTSRPLDDSTAVHKVLVEAITGQLEARRSVGRRFGSYLATSLESRSDDGAIWLGRHALLPDARVVQIRSWYLSPYRYDPAALDGRRLQLERAAAALAKVGQHPNLATLRDFGEADGEFYEVTDFSPNGTLLTAFLRGRLAALDTSARLELLAGIGRGLDAAQRHGVIHRALSPDRILLDAAMVPRLTGFDLAWLDGAAHTVYGEAPTTDLEFVAPELRSRDYDVFDNTDLFALGRMAGLVFGGATARQDAVHDAMMALAARCASVDPAQRPTSPAAFLEALETLASPPQLETALSPPGPRPAGPGDTLDGVNIILEVLGRGASARVYRVFNEPLGLEVALKLADVGTTTDLTAEYRLLRLLTSPRFPRAHWLGRIGTGAAAQAYVLMDLAVGPTLRERLHQGALGADEAVRIGLALLEAAAALHEHGTLHRDLKPDNVVLTAEGAVVVDLGTARPIADAGRAPETTLRYTPSGLSATGWTPAADVFAIACMMLEAATGALPWDDSPPTGPILVAEGTFPPTVRLVLERALAGGFQSAADFRDAVEAALRPPPEPANDRAPEPEPPAREPAPPEREPEETGDATSPPVWSGALVTAVASHAIVLVPLAHAMVALVERLGGPAARLLATERRLARLEAPLSIALPSAYRALAVGLPATAWNAESGEDTAAETYTFGPGAVWTIDAVHPMDWPALFGNRDTPAAFWAAARSENAAVTPARTLVLPIGDRQTDALEAVLAARAAALAQFVSEARAAAPVTLVVRTGALFLAPSVPAGWFQVGGPSLCERLLPIVRIESAP